MIERRLPASPGSGATIRTCVLHTREIGCRTHATSPLQLPPPPRNAFAMQPEPTAAPRGPTHLHLHMRTHANARASAMRSRALECVPRVNKFPPGWRVPVAGSRDTGTAAARPRSPLPGCSCRPGHPPGAVPPSHCLEGEHAHAGNSTVNLGRGTLGVAPPPPPLSSEQFGAGGRPGFRGVRRAGGASTTGGGDGVRFWREAGFASASSFGPSHVAPHPVRPGA